jgi:hypothetical protein
VQYRPLPPTKGRLHRRRLGPGMPTERLLNVALVHHGPRLGAFSLELELVTQLVHINGAILVVRPLPDLVPDRPLACRAGTLGQTHHIFWHGITSGLSLLTVSACASGTVSSLAAAEVSDNAITDDMWESNGFGRGAAGVRPVRIEPVRSFQSMGPAPPSSITSGS